MSFKHLQYPQQADTAAGAATDVTTVVPVAIPGNSNGNYSSNSNGSNSNGGSSNGGNRDAKRKLIRTLSLIAVLLVPLVYAALFAWSVWDPYGRVNTLSVAYVSEDAGATQDGKQINIGDELAKKTQGVQKF